MSKSSIVLLFLYLFSYGQVAPAFEAIKWEHELRIEKEECSDLVPIPSHSRSKRFFWFFIIALLVGAAVGSAGSVIRDEITINRTEYRTEYRTENRTEYRTKRSLEDENPMLINRLINYDIEGAKDFEYKLMKLDPKAARNVEISEEGFQCDEDFCSTRNGLYGMGLCTPFACRCRNQTPIFLACKNGMFDPVNSNCNSSINLGICGHAFYN